MKPILLAFILFAGTVTKTFASDGRITTIEPVVLKSFQNTFAAATEVGWTLAQDLYKAEFLLNGQYLTAYYNPDGTMQALTRHISAASLPVILQTELKNIYKNQWVSDVFEVTKDGDVQYFVTLEDANSKLILRSASTIWKTYQKQRKN